MIDKNTVLAARRADLEQYLRGKGRVLKKEGRQFRVEKHSGLVVSGNKWYSHTLLKGGNALDYMMFIEGIGFREAVRALTGISQVPENTSGMAVESRTPDIPERNTNNMVALTYLIGSRGIASEIILPLFSSGRIYQSAIYNNVVFTGIDNEGFIRYIMQRSTIPGNTLKFESFGSDKRFSFSLAGSSDLLMVFESPTDLLSFMSFKHRLSDENPHMLSLGGVSDIALEAYLNRMPGIRYILLMLDNDRAGHAACLQLHDKYSSRGYQMQEYLPEGKDWNLELLKVTGKKGTV